MAGFNAPDVKTTAADSLFGNADMFAPMKDNNKAVDDLFASLAPKEVKLSAASQQSINAAGSAYQDSIAAANSANSSAQSLMKQQQQAQIDALNKETAAYTEQAQKITQQTLEQQAELLKAQAAARKKQIDATVEALDADPTAAMGVDLEAIFNSEEYKQMGTIQRRDWANLKVTELKAKVDENLAKMAGLEVLPTQPWSVEQQLADPDGWKRVEKLITASATIEKSLRAQVSARVDKEERDINAGSKLVQDIKASFKVAKNNNKIGPLADMAYRADTAAQRIGSGKSVNVRDLEGVMEIPDYILKKATMVARNPDNPNTVAYDKVLDPKNLTAAEINFLTTGAKIQLNTVVPKLSAVRDKTTELRKGFSDEQTNDTRNMAYENAQWESANPDANWAQKTLKGGGLGLSYINSNLVNSLPATAVSAVTAAAAGAAAGAVIGAVPTGGAGAAPGALIGAGGGLVRAVALSFGAAAVNPYIVSDYADSALANFDNVPTEQLAKSVQGWDGYLAVANGDPEAARKIFIASSVGKGVGQVKLIAAALSIIDPGNIAGALIGGAGARFLSGNLATSLTGMTAGRLATGVGVTALSTAGEALEEGTTQYLANTPAFEAGVLDDRWAGVAFAAGIGAAMGGIMGGTVGTASGVLSTPTKVRELRARNEVVSGYTREQIQQISQFKSDILGITAERYTTPGAADTNTISSAFITALAAVDSDRPRQALYDSVVEDPIFKSMTSPEQRQEIALLLNDRLGIKTNQFTLAGVTTAQRAYGGDTTAVADPITQAAINIRDGQEITNGVSARVAEAANSVIAMLDSNPASLETTFERQADALVALGLARGALNLTTEEFNTLQNYAYNELNAKPERMTDAEVEQFNQVQAIRTRQQNAAGSAGNANPQSVGVNSATQTPLTGNPTGNPTGTPTGTVTNTGVPVQAGTVGTVQNPTTPISGSSGTPVPAWNYVAPGQGRPTGLLGPIATQTPTGIGSLGTPQAGSDTDTQRTGPTSQGQSTDSVAKIVSDFFAGIVRIGLYARMRKLAVDKNGEAAGVFFDENLGDFIENVYVPQATPAEAYTFLSRATGGFAIALADGDTDFNASMINAIVAFSAPTATPTSQGQSTDSVAKIVIDFLTDIVASGRYASLRKFITDTNTEDAGVFYDNNLQAFLEHIYVPKGEQASDFSNLDGAASRLAYALKDAGTDFEAAMDLAAKDLGFGPVVQAPVVQAPVVQAPVVQAPVDDIVATVAVDPAEEGATVSDQTDTMRYGLPPNSESVANATLGEVQNEQAQRKRELRSSNAKPKQPRKKRGSLKAKGQPEVQPEQVTDNTAGAAEDQTTIAPQQEAQTIQGGLDFDATPEVTAEVMPEGTVEVTAEVVPFIRLVRDPENRTRSDAVLFSMERVPATMQKALGSIERMELPMFNYLQDVGFTKDNADNATFHIIDTGLNAGNLDFLDSGAWAPMAASNKAALRRLLAETQAYLANETAPEVASGTVMKTTNTEAVQGGLDLESIAEAVVEPAPVQSIEDTGLLGQGGLPFDAPSFTDAEVVSAMGTLPESDQKSIKTFATGGGKNAEIRARLGITDSTTAVRVATETALADTAVGGLNQPAWQGVSKAFKTAIGKLLKALQSGVKSIALVSLTTLALLNADLTTTPAMAAPQVVEMQTVIPSVSPDANAVRNYVASKNDSNGKPYIVADKKAGTLYLFDAKGNKLNETPAIFGRDVSDTARSGSTPAGKFELNYMPYEVSGYGGTVQAFVQQANAKNPNKGEIFAIHRVLDVPGQNRLGRLTSKKASDNRISDGCINVPAAFYNNILDGKFSGPMYVIPETTSYTGNRFGTQGTDNTVLQTTTAKPTATVVTSAQITAEPNYENIADMRAEQPISQPVVLGGTTPSSQVAMIEPIVTENGTATSAFVPEGVLTPAEQTAAPTFDTPPPDVTSDGLTLYDIVGGIMGTLALSFGAAKVSGRRRRALRANSNAQNPQGVVGSTQPFVDQPAPNPAPLDPAAVASSATQAEEIARMQQEQAELARLTRLEWYDYFNSVESDPVPIDTLTNLYWRVENAFTDNSLFDGVNTENTTRPWRLDKYGVMKWMLSGSGGATTALDEWARKVNAPKFGVEMDSSTISTKLARIKGMQSGALAILSKMGLKKVETIMQQVSDKTNYGLEKTETDIGDYANLRHYNESGIDHFLGGFAYEVEQLAIMKGSVEADIARKTAAGASTRVEEAILKQVSKDLRKAQTAHIQNITYVEGYAEARDFVNRGQAELAAATTAQETKIAQEKINMAANMLTTIQELEDNPDTWLGKVRLPGGRTREQTRTLMAELEGEYDIADLTNASDAIYAAVRSNVGYATANGVFTVEDLARFREVGLTNYVPAWAPKKDKPVLGDESAVEDFVDVTPIDSLLAEPTYFKGLGMAPDITRFSRKGSLEAPADAMTNLRVQTTNLATRVAERQFTLEVEQLFEGSHYNEDATGQRIPVTGFLARQDLIRNLPQDRIDMLANNESFTPGIGRVKKGDPIPGGKSARMKAKGFDSTGEYRDYVYYFTDDMVQQDVERSLRNSAKPSNKFTKGVRRTTGIYAGLMTHLNVLWNIIAGARTVGENAGNLFLRDLRGRDGNKLSEVQLQRTFAKNNALFAGDMVGIARALISGEEVTQAQRLLAEARRQGTLHIYSDVVNQKRERDMNAANTQSVGTNAKRLASKVIRSNPVTRGVADATNKAWDAYSSGYVETVQIIPILATLQTALDLGVNPAEAHRVVRDMFDPQRNSQEWGALTTIYAFANSTKSGMYTTTKNLTQYGAKGPAMVAMVAAFTAIMAAAVGQIEGDDEDGIPKNASDNISNSQRGIGVPMFGGKGFIPVGHGLNTVAATLGGVIYKSIHGKIEPGEAGKAMVGALMDNLTPFQVANSKVMEDSVWSWLMLSLAPTLSQGVLETATNSVAFTGASVMGQKTPMGQNDADRDSFYTPQVYKDVAQYSKYTLGIDVAPEKLEHILKRYAIGPAEIFPYLAEDIGTKTAGTMSTNADELGLWGIMTGVTSFDPKFYDIRRRSYEVSNKAIKVQQKYRGISSVKVELVKQQLMEQGAPDSDIEFITNNITYQKEQKKLMKEFKASVEKADSIADRDSLEYNKAQAEIQMNYAAMEQNMQAFMEMNNGY